MFKLSPSLESLALLAALSEIQAHPINVTGHQKRMEDQAVRSKSPFVAEQGHPCPQPS